MTQMQVDGQTTSPTSYKEQSNLSKVKVLIDPSPLPWYHSRVSQLTPIKSTPDQPGPRETSCQSRIHLYTFKHRMVKIDALGKSGSLVVLDHDGSGVVLLGHLLELLLQSSRRVLLPTLGLERLPNLLPLLSLELLLSFLFLLQEDRHLA